MQVFQTIARLVGLFRKPAAERPQVEPPQSAPGWQWRWRPMRSGNNGTKRPMHLKKAQRRRRTELAKASRRRNRR